MIIREGDMVRLRPLRVEWVRCVGDKLWFSIEGLRAFPCWSSRDVEEVIPAPRPFAVDERVKIRTGSLVTIIAIHNGRAWCKRGDDQLVTVSLADLTSA